MGYALQLLDDLSLEWQRGTEQGTGKTKAVRLSAVYQNSPALC